MKEEKKAFLDFNLLKRIIRLAHPYRLVFYSSIIMSVVLAVLSIGRPLIIIYATDHYITDKFFDAEKYPQLKFESTSFEKIGDTIYLLKGNITIRETTLPIQLDVEYGGKATDFYGNTKAGFEISGKLNRKDFGLTWGGVTETGSIVLHDEVKLVMNVQLQLNK